MTVTSGQIASKMSISVISYQPGLENSQAELHKAIADTLQDFGLAGEIF
jgi:hypothetical protein